MKKFLIILSLILLFLLVGTPVSAGTMTGYGAIFAPTSDYSSLNTKGKVNMIQTNTGSDWASALSQAEATGQKLALIIGWQSDQICQGSAGWTWNGNDWTLNSTGTSFMDFIAGYIKGGGNGLLALYTVHEPYNYTHSPSCNTDAIKKLYTLLKNEATKRGLTSSQLPLFADIDTTSRSDFGPGLCDYCADWYYPNGECSGSTWEARVASCIDKMRTNYQGLQAKSPASTFVAFGQSFGTGGGYTMPSASEMEYMGNAIINELKSNFSGNFIYAWYVWQGIYTTYLKNSPGGDASYQVMANVYNTSGGVVTPPPTTPTPTIPASNGDGNGDGIIDGLDYVIWLNHYNQTISGANNGNFNGDAKVDGLDYVIWLNNYLS